MINIGNNVNKATIQSRSRTGGCVYQFNILYFIITVPLFFYLRPFFLFTPRPHHIFIFLLLLLRDEHLAAGTALRNVPNAAPATPP